MRKKLALVLASALLVLSLAGCGDVQVKQADVKVEPRNSSSTTYIYYRNGYKFGGTTITRNEDGTITITITALPPETFLSD